MVTLRKKDAPKKITIALKDLDKVCRKCGTVQESTRQRTYKSKDYVGPCGDSFCFSSCDMSACHPVTEQICNKCEKKLAKKESK